MKNEETRNAVLEHLRKTPIVEIACNKSGIGRTTFYRWCRESSVFAKAADEAIRDGRGLVNDVAVSQLLNAIKSGNLAAVMFWLKHFDANFKTKVDITGRITRERRAFTREEKYLLEEALRLAMPKDHGTSE